LLLVANAAEPANRPPIAAALIDAIFVVRDIENLSVRVVRQITRGELGCIYEQKFIMDV
jgi:hypothetical protein